MTFIAGELNMQVPEISFEDFEEFIKSSKTLHESIPGHNNEEFVYKQRNLRVYPWERRILEFQGKEFHSYSSNTLFKPLMSLINSLPIIPESRGILLISQCKQENYDFNFHFDKDPNYGFRITFGLDTKKPFVEFGKMKNDFKNARQHLKMIEPNMVEDKIYSLIPTRSNTVFCFSSTYYPHRVPLINADNRVVLIIAGTLTMSIDKLDFIQTLEDL